MKAFASMSDEQIMEELLKLCIAERFDGDIQWLIRVNDGDHSDEKWDEVRSWLIHANPLRHPSTKTPAPTKLGRLDASAKLPPGEILSVKLVNRLKR